MRLFIAGILLVWGVFPAIAAAEDGRVTSEEIEALRSAVIDLKSTFPDTYRRADSYLGRIGDLARSSPGQRRKAFDQLRREALLDNPLLASRPLLYVVRPQYKPDHHNTETMFQTGEINTAGFVGGGALKALDVRTGAVRTLVDCTGGIVRDPEVYFDGGRIVFSMRRDIQDDYHIYEVNADGSGFRQLTFAPGVSDIDPLYLADDGIAFSSTREPKYCMCNRHIMANMYRMDADGANIVQIGKSTLFEGHGSLMPDGRILYSRWEYVDRNFGDAQGLWTQNPDGTGHALYWGNNTESPGAVLDARVIAETMQVLCVFGSCHDRPWGALAIVDRRLGMDLREPVVRTWPADAVNLVGEGDAQKFNIDTFMRVSPKYEDPYPLSDKYFLCSRETDKHELMGIYLVDAFGNEVLVHCEGPGCYDPMPIGPRPRPHVLATLRDYDGKEASLYVADVYSGTHMKGVERGTVKFLRVIESPEKRYWTSPSWNGQGQEAPAMNWHDFNNKRILGTVPVEADGSAFFTVPADTFVYFQLLDERGMMVQSMRSGTMLQPGERVGCVGCHEARNSAPHTDAPPRLMAMGRAPSQMQGWYGPPRLFSYEREVQPVFDKHCVSCHDYGKAAADKVILAGDPDMVFNASYNELWRKNLIRVVGAGPAQIQQPRSWGSHASKLVEVLQKHHEVDAESFDRIVTWLDLNAPYYPSYGSAYPANLAGRCPLDDNAIEKLTALTGIKFAEHLDCAKSIGPLFSFTRPELSPCLAKLPDKASAKYQEALSIIQAGRDRLAQHPHPCEDPAQLCPVDQDREKKYQARRLIELENREAVRIGAKRYEGQPPAPERPGPPTDDMRRMQRSF